MQNRLIVALTDGEGKVLFSQPYNEFQYENRSKDILIHLRGKGLIQILQDELGNISYEKNRFILKQILFSDPNVTAMTLLGKIAEAVIVRRCIEDEDINKKFFDLARRKKSKQSTSNRFKAIGTGLKTTRENFPTKYNPSDTQRDIIWIDDQGKKALMANDSTMSGLEAGLQVKVSQHGSKYIFSDLINERYEVPIVYFPLNNDFNEIIENIFKSKFAHVVDPITAEPKEIEIGKDLVDVRAYDYDAFEEVRDYYPIIYDLIIGKTKLEDLINIAYGNGTLENAILLTTLGESNAETFILK